MENNNDLEKRMKLSREATLDLAESIRSKFNLNPLDNPVMEKDSSPYLHATLQYEVNNFRKVQDIVNSDLKKQFDLEPDFALLHGERYGRGKNENNVDALIRKSLISGGDWPDTIIVVGFDPHSKTVYELQFHGTSDKRRVVLVENPNGKDKFDWYNFKLENSK